MLPRPEEERGFLPAARRALSAEDLAEIETRLRRPDDPLFGTPSEDRFAALRRNILAGAEDAA